MKLQFDPEATSWHFIHDILGEARAINKEELVANHLVGAQLSVQFPIQDFPIVFHSDAKPFGPGGYSVHNIVVYVSGGPTLTDYDKYKTIAASGHRVYLLVPVQLVVGCRQIAESVAPKRLTVLSIEDFVSQILDELVVLSEGELISGFRRLLEVYNERVDSVETDKSMLIEIPRNLLD